MMTTPNELSIAQLAERLNQERQTFAQRKEQDARSFRLRLAFGWVAVFILPTILVAAILILTFHRDFSAYVVGTAATALLVDGLATAGSLYHLMLGGISKRELSPVTAPPNETPIGDQKPKIKPDSAVPEAISASDQRE
jgi:hypothetical protein